MIPFPAVIETTAFSFEAELESLQPDLRYFVLSLTASRHAADEIVQDTNAIALSKSEVFQPGTNLKAWVFQIASNQTKRWRREESRRNGREIAGDQLFGNLAANVTEEETALSEQKFVDEQAALQSCIGKLRPKHQELICARYLQNRELSDLSSEFGLTNNAIAQKLFRIRKRLASCIAETLKTA